MAALFCCINLKFNRIHYKCKILLVGRESRGLRSRARFKRDETRWDWKAIPELAGPGQDYFFMAPLLGKIQEKIREKFGTGWDYSVPLGKSLERSWNDKFGNSRFIFGTETGQELASPEWPDLDRTEKRIFPHAPDWKFPRFFREKSGLRDMAFENIDLWPQPCFRTYVPQGKIWTDFCTLDCLIFWGSQTSLRQ